MQEVDSTICYIASEYVSLACYVIKMYKAAYLKYIANIKNGDIRISN